MRHLNSGLALAGLAALVLAGCGEKVDATKDGATAPAATTTAPAVGEVATPETMPSRKPGLWAQTITAEGAPPMVIKVCLDAATDKQMSVMGSQASKQACPDSKMVRTATGYDVTATCNMGSGGTSVTKGVVSGDYNAKYEVDLTSTTTGAALAQRNGTAKVKLVAEWQGPCPADMSPGDQVMPGGMTINMTGFDPEKARAIAKDAAAAAAKAQ